jgi:hypothetical protein
MPQPCKEASHVITTMRADPVSPARKAACNELATGGHRGRPRVAYSSRTSRMKTAALEIAAGSVMIWL